MNDDDLKTKYRERANGDITVVYDAIRAAPTRTRKLPFRNVSYKDPDEVLALIDKIVLAKRRKAGLSSRLFDRRKYVFQPDDINPKQAATKRNDAIGSSDRGIGRHYVMTNNRKSFLPENREETRGPAIARRSDDV